MVSYRNGIGDGTNLIGGQFEANSETTGFDWFPLNDLPELAEEKNTRSQIGMCFEAHSDPNWEVLFD